MVIEWTLGLFIPLLIAGPVCKSSCLLESKQSHDEPVPDYVHKGYRFQIFEGFGCTDARELSVLSLLTLTPWYVVPPVISIIFYYRA